MTFNVGNGLARPARLAEGLRTAGADVVGLVEATASQAEEIRTALSDLFPYQVHVGDGIPGKALISRYPILESKSLEFHPRRPDLLATVDVEGQQLRVVVAHPPPPRLHRTGYHFTVDTALQFAELMRIAVTDAPTVLLGDFNMVDSHAHHHRLVAAGFIDAFRAVGQGAGFTYPRRHGRVRLVPVLRIDYVWHSSHLRSLWARVGVDAGSDHLPVIVDLAWQPSSGSEQHNEILSESILC
ncbi:MAG TPA: endonuclease/exonuclease/phosphatase family protein [Chloroflexota bacterium]|nr:endonuclease/exonuclease/phosphatase family protein [Chloroflexota bacterium]